MTGKVGAVDQGHAVRGGATDAELERSIASVPGVVSAAIERSSATGRARLRLRLAPGEDEQAVAWAVAATLRERFGIALDPDAIRSRPAVSADPADDPVRVVAMSETRERLRLAAARALDGIAEMTDVAGPSDAAGPADPAGPADLTGPVGLTGPVDTAASADLAEFVDLAELLDRDGVIPIGSVDAAPTTTALATPGVGSTTDATPDRSARTAISRAVIRDLQVHRDTRGVQVIVVLAHGERSAEGRAVSVPTSHGTLRAVAEATVGALRALTGGAVFVGVERVSAKLGDDAPIATVVLSLLTRRGDERLLGAAFIHDGAEHAVLRATLDALNRRVTPLLPWSDATPDIPV